VDLPDTLPAPSRPGSGTGRGLLLRDLRKSFGAIEAVAGIDLDIPPGQTVALLGPNGAGKSTTLDMVLGLTEPDTGTIEIFGESPAAATAHGRVAAMLQTGMLIRDLSVRELVSMVASLYEHPMPVDHALELAGAVEFADRRTHKLSGGQTQRVRFAVAIVADPELLVLDEPTVALDVEARRSFWDSMQRLAGEGRTILFATHLLDEADAFADRVLLLARGEIVADGPSAEIKAMIGGRTIRAVLPGVAPDALAALPGATAADRHGDAVTITCADSDTALRALLDHHPAVHDIEVAGAGLEAAFLELTRDDAPDATVVPSIPPVDDPTRGAR
jgi:ABC-2 type transport system ATP-binding protein